MEQMDQKEIKFGKLILVQTNARWIKSEYLEKNVLLQ